MNTFLPFKNYRLSAQCLDNKRLGKQRVECLQILKTLLGHSEGWINHPAVKMWRGYEVQLFFYGANVCEEWKRRGYKDTCAKKMADLFTDFKNDFEPWWLGGPIHLTHQSNLLRKDPEHYSKWFKDIPKDLEYFWPI